MDDRYKGIRVRGKSIQIDFMWNGLRCRETVAIPVSRAGLREAMRLRNAVELQVARGTLTPAKYQELFPNSRRIRELQAAARNKTVAHALDDFLRATKTRLAPSTWQDYNRIVESHLRPAFGDRRLADVTSGDVKAWLAGLAASAKRTNNILIPLRAAFRQAFEDELIARNPLERVRNRPHYREDPKPFAPSEIATILSELPRQTRNLIQFAFYTGLRTSELIALEWSDVDMHAQVVHVQRASVRRSVKAPKTHAGKRTVKLFAPALAALHDQMTFTYPRAGRVFHNPASGQPWLTDGQIRKAWMRALRRTEIPYRFPYHTRHTYASLMLTAGENPMWFAAQMGHRDWGMIRKRYGRYLPEVDPSAGERADAYLSQLGHKEEASD